MNTRYLIPIDDAGFDALILRPDVRSGARPLFDIPWLSQHSVVVPFLFGWTDKHVPNISMNADQLDKLTEWTSSRSLKPASKATIREQYLGFAAELDRQMQNSQYWNRWKTDRRIA